MHWESHHIALEARLVRTLLPNLSICSCWCDSLSLPLHSLLLLLSVSRTSFHYIPLYLNVITKKFTITGKSCLLWGIDLWRHFIVMNGNFCIEFHAVVFKLSHLSTSFTYLCVCCALHSHEFHLKTDGKMWSCSATILPRVNVRARRCVRVGKNRFVALAVGEASKKRFPAFLVAKMVTFALLALLFPYLQICSWFTFLLCSGLLFGCSLFATLLQSPCLFTHFLVICLLFLLLLYLQ